VIDIIMQIICYFIDGTYFPLVRFDELKKDIGYAGVIKERTEFSMMIYSNVYMRN